MIRGNRANCAQFAQSYRLDWLVHRLESQMSSKGKCSNVLYLNLVVLTKVCLQVMSAMLD